MDILQQRVRQARRRLAMQRLVTLLPGCWFVTLLVAATLIGVDRFYPLGFDPALLVGGAVGLGLLVALAWSFFTRGSTLAAALEIDRRCGLKERISTALVLGSAERETPAGQAMLADALRHLDRVAVADEFALSLGRRAWLPLAPAALAFVLAMFLEPAVGQNQAAAVAQKQAVKKQVEQTSDNLRKKLAERQKEAREKGLKEAEGVLSLLEQQTKKLRKSGEGDRKQAMMQLNDMAKETEKRRQELANADAMKEQLQQLKDLQKGPADKLADAMRQGDLQQAMKELEKLQRELGEKKLNPQAQENLAKQLDQLGQKLQQLAQAEQQLQQELREQVAQQRAAGQNAQANDLEQQLAKRDQGKGQQQALQDLAQQLSQASQSLQNGDAQDAANQLRQLSQQMNKLQQQMAESKLLENALDQIAQAKQSMAQQDGAGGGQPQEGEGMAQAQGQGGQQAGGEPGQGKNEEGPGQQGKGIGTQPGQHVARDHDVGKGGYDSKVGQEVGQGKARITGMVRGPNVKGQVEQEIQTEFESVRGGAVDPLTDQQLSRGQRDHAKEYFDGLREGD